MVTRDALASDRTSVVLILATATTAGTGVAQILLGKHYSASICVPYRTNMLNDSSDFMS